MSTRRIISISLLISLPLVIGLIFPTRNQLLHTRKIPSLRILDRNNELLREYLSREDATSRYCRLEQISPWLVKATLVNEDKRFFYHRGIDPIGIIRAIIQNIKARKIVAGGSTITQQLARALLRSPKRNIFYKLIETFLAINIELKLTKEEILELYFNYAPYGNQTYGVEAASHLYFRKPARDLSPAEAAYLSVLPKAPSYFDPYRYPQRIKNEYLKNLRRMYTTGIIDSLTYDDALSQPIDLVPEEYNFSAPHFCEYIRTELIQKGYPDPAVVKTTLDLHIQQTIEQILKNNIKRLTDANVTNGAAMVIDNRTMEILAYVGSVDFFNPLISGEVDGVRALRQPGSAVKPFTYAIALENGATPATLIPDLPTYETTAGGDYTPRNYDEKYHGMVRLRTALACSYNIPAVRVCGEFGAARLLERLKKLGFKNLKKSPLYYGVGLTLGNGEVTLLELTRAYSVFSRNGVYLKSRALLSIDGQRYEPEAEPERVFSPEIAYIISDILSDNSARSPAFGEYSPLNFPFFCAAKTGTSKDFRDNWCVGFTDKYLVGVWVGNFDGSPMHHVSGITGAGPIFRDIILTLHRKEPPRRIPKPENIVFKEICAVSGRLAAEYCKNRMSEIFIKGTEPTDSCRIHNEGVIADGAVGYLEVLKEEDREFTISFPDDGDIFKIDPVLRKEYQSLRFRIRTSHKLKEVTWFVDDEKVGSAASPYSITWRLVPGEHKITASAVTEKNLKLHSPAVTILVLE